MFVLNRFPVSSFTLLLAIAAVRLPAAAQALKPAEGAAAGAPAPALGPRVAPPARGALNPAGWTVGPDGKRHAPIPKRETEPSPLPDLKPEQPLITVNGEPISWGAVRDYAELLVSEMRIPHGVTPQQFEEERDNLLMRRVYNLGRHHILKTLLAQEARRKGIVLTPEEVAAKEKEVQEKLTRLAQTAGGALPEGVSGTRARFITTISQTRCCWPISRRMSSAPRSR
jgi:hypothetical protein